jgi:hypothetical protein
LRAALQRAFAADDSSLTSSAIWMDAGKKVKVGQRVLALLRLPCSGREGQPPSLPTQC